MNLIALHTIHGQVIVSSKDLANTNRKLLSIYTRTGRRLCDTPKGETMMRSGRGTSVHRDNLYASRQMAEDAYESIIQEALK